MVLQKEQNTGLGFLKGLGNFFKNTKVGKALSGRLSAILSGGIGGVVGYIAASAFNACIQNTGTGTGFSGWASKFVSNLTQGLFGLDQTFEFNDKTAQEVLEREMTEWTDKITPFLKEHLTNIDGDPSYTDLTNGVFVEQINNGIKIASYAAMYYEVEGQAQEDAIAAEGLNAPILQIKELLTAPESKSAVFYSIYTSLREAAIKAAKNNGVHYRIKTVKISSSDKYPKPEEFNWTMQSTAEVELLTMGPGKEPEGNDDFIDFVEDYEKGKLPNQPIVSPKFNITTKPGKAPNPLFDGAGNLEDMPSPSLQPGGGQNEYITPSTPDTPTPPQQGGYIPQPGGDSFQPQPQPQPQPSKPTSNETKTKPNWVVKALGTTVLAVLVSKILK